MHSGTVRNTGKSNGFHLLLGGPEMDHELLKNCSAEAATKVLQKVTGRVDMKITKILLNGIWRNVSLVHTICLVSLIAWLGLISVLRKISALDAFLSLEANTPKEFHWSLTYFQRRCTCPSSNRWSRYGYECTRLSEADCCCAPTFTYA